MHWGDGLRQRGGVPARGSQRDLSSPRRAARLKERIATLKEQMHRLGWRGWS